MMVHFRQSTNRDVPAIVTIHNSAFKGFFLTSLGSNFLEFYYTCFIKSVETVTIVAEENGVILGFAAASKLSKGFNGRLIRHNLISFGFLSIKMLFTNPAALVRLTKNLTKKGTDVIDNEDYAELYSIGVSASVQGKDIGKKLLTEAEAELKRQGVQKVSLTTDYYNNEKAVGFYHSMGYEKLYEFVAYPNRKMYRLIKTL